MRKDEFIKTIPDLAESIRGTCKSFDFEDWELTDKEIEEVDDLVFNCNSCGWWCETSEMAESDGEQICGDCDESSVDE